MVLADIFDEVTPAIEAAGLTADCLGGGRILHEPEKKTIKVFGYSTVSAIFRVGMDLLGPTIGRVVGKY